MRLSARFALLGLLLLASFPAHAAVTAPGCYAFYDIVDACMADARKALAGAGMNAEGMGAPADASDKTAMAKDVLLKANANDEAGFLAQANAAKQSMSAAASCNDVNAFKAMHAQMTQACNALVNQLSGAPKPGTPANVPASGEM